MDFLTSNMGLLGGGGATAIILWILKKVPNEKLYDFVENVFEKIGICCTLGITRISVTKKYWNSTIEPWVIDLLDNTCAAAINGFIKGLKSDN